MNYFRFFYLTTLISRRQYVKTKKNRRCIFRMSLFPVSSFKRVCRTFIVLLPLFYVFILDVPVRRSLFVSLPYYVMTGMYVLLGSASHVTDLGKKATDEVLNNQYILGTWSEKFALKVYLLGKYFVMLFYPYPLSSDYSFQSDSFLHKWAACSSSDRWFFTILHYLGCLFIYFFEEKNRDLFSCCLLRPLISFISNLAVEIGTTFSERLSYILSFAFCVLIAMGIVYGLENVKICRRNPNNWRCCVVWDWLCWWVPFRLLPKKCGMEKWLYYLHTI